jgi:hypothetical protein
VNPTPRQGIRLCACPMRRLLLATLLLLVLVPAAGAYAADRPSDLLVDACRDEKVDGTYSQRTYRRALDQLPADSDQYTACRDVINRARLAALNNRDRGGGGGGGNGGGGGSSGGGGTTTGSGGGSTDSGRRGNAGGAAEDRAPSAAEQKQVQDAVTSGSRPVRVGGELVQPGAVGNLSNSTRELPTPVVAVLVALAVCGLAAVAVAGWSRVVARRSH